MKHRWLYRCAGFGPALNLVDTNPAITPLQFVSGAAKLYGFAPDPRTPVPNETKGTVFCCTHHTGAIDFAVAYSVIARFAPNLRVVMNKALVQLPPLASIAIPTHPISAGQRNEVARKALAEHLKKGGNVLVFPAGKVARKTNEGVVDFPWRYGIGELIRDHARSVAVVHVSARNSRFFYWVRRFSERLSMSVFAYELARRRQGRVPIYVGPLIPSVEFKGQKAEAIVARLRSDAYALNHQVHQEENRDCAIA
jgi:putative hemolysin